LVQRILPVHPLGEDGASLGVYDFSTFPLGPQLQEAFAAAFDRHCGPGAAARRQPTCRSLFNALRRYAHFLAATDLPPRTVRDLRPARWDSYVLAPGRSAGAHGELANLRGFLPGLTGLPEETRRALGRRLGKRPDSEESAYSKREFLRIQDAARDDVRAALRRIRAGRAHLQRWRAGEFDRGGDAWSVGSILDDLLRGAGNTRAVPTQVRRRHQEMVSNLLQLRVADSAAALFPGPLDAAALAVALFCATGWNRAVLDQMPVPERLAGDGVAVYRAEVVKHRRPAGLVHDSENFPDSGGTSAGRLLRHAIEITSTAREAHTGEPTMPSQADRLLTYHCGSTDRLLTGVPASAHFRSWTHFKGLVTDDGQPMEVKPRRLRRSVGVHFGGPRHQSETTYTDIYLLRDRITQQAAAPVIEAGQHAALADARQRVTMRLLAGADTEQVCREAGVPLRRAQALVAGTLDTPVGACIDFHSGPHTEPGNPCPVSFLECLACGNAYALDRHLPRLVHLLDTLDSLRSAVSPDTWDTWYRQHWTRLHALLDQNTTAEQRAAARQRTTQQDREMIDDLMRRRLDA
jgi:hypothetical protein